MGIRKKIKYENDWKKIENDFNKLIKEFSEKEFWEFVKIENPKEGEFDCSLFEKIIERFIEDMPDEEYWKIIMKYIKRKELYEQMLDWDWEYKKEVLDERRTK